MGTCDYISKEKLSRLCANAYYNQESLTSPNEPKMMQSILMHTEEKISYQNEKKEIKRNEML